MAFDWQNDDRLPDSVREGLALFCNQLWDALGEQLVSIILYGGLARGEYARQSSDVNVMVVLKQVTIAALDQMVSPVQKGARDFRLAVMVLNENDLLDSTDAFPIKFLDVQRHHRVLWGKDVLAELSIHRDHLRLRCEQEIKNLLLRLRQFYLRRSHYPDFIENTLTRAISSFLTNLGVLVEMKTGEAAATKVAVIAAVEKLGVNGQPLRNVLALKLGELKPDAAELKRLYGDFMQAVQQAAWLINELDNR
jgi:predicted nucleotidyltransferase